MMYRTRNAGFSLIEVMVTLVLGLVVLAAIVNLFINTKQNHVQNERVETVLENGRFALRLLSTDLKTVGFMGGVLDNNNISQDGSLSLVADCGQSGETNWAYDFTTYRYMQFLYDVSGSTASTQFQCINSSNVVNNTDVLAIKRVYTEKETGALSQDAVYLRSDYNTGCLWFHSASSTIPSGGTCPTTDYEDWRYILNVYYIRNYAVTAGDGIPTLCKKYLSVSAGGTPEPTMNEICLAEGVEHFHIQYGLDTDSPKDGVANRFVSDPTATQVSEDAVSARIYVLVRSKTEDPTFNNTKTYHMGDRSVTVNDKYYRRIYTTQVILRNPLHMAPFTGL